MTKTVKVGLVGTGFVGDIHHASYKAWVRDAEVVAVASLDNAAIFAAERGIPDAYNDYRQMLKDKDIDLKRARWWSNVEKRGGPYEYLFPAFGLSTDVPTREKTPSPPTAFPVR